MEVGLGRFGDARLEKAGSFCARGLWRAAARARAFASSAAIGPAPTGRSYSCSDLVGDCPATIAMGAKVVGHTRHVSFQIAEIKNRFTEILRMIAELRPPPVALTG
jgi:hypothetical protein